MTIYAKLVRPDSGYDSDIKSAKVLNPPPMIYKVESVEMGQWHTSIRLEGHNKSFNSVHFDFYDGDENKVDIYRMPEFNPYLKR